MSAAIFCSMAVSRGSKIRMCDGGVCPSALSHGDGFCLSCALAGSGLVVLVVVSSSVLDAGLGLAGIWLMRLVGFNLEISGLGTLGRLNWLDGD